MTVSPRIWRWRSIARCIRAIHTLGMGWGVLLHKSELAAVAVSMGGPETLMVRPSQAVHSNLSPEERARSGISETLIRLSVGLEATEDLIADFEQALSMVPSATA